MPDPTPDPITTQDLYGATPPAPLPVEETPEIPMEPPEGTPSTNQIPPPAPMPKVSFGSVVITIVVFIILFIAGILLSSHIRPLLSGLTKKTVVVPTPTIVAATPTPADPFAGWKTETIAGLSYKLPPAVLAPTCDGASCVSQGTYLPGGTRFTVAPKSVTQALSTFQGVAITDIAGTAFTSHDATISGHIAIEYTGAFSGRTSGGYGFTQMHGFMIEVSPTATLEMNHFTPAGITTDFAKDDELFTQIISTLSLTPQTPIATTAPIPATTSGY